VQSLIGFLQLNGRTLGWVFRGCIRFDETLRQIIRIGVQAIPMTALTSFSIGFTLAMQGAAELTRMGAAAYVPDLISMSLLRELGPLLVGVVVIGRSGSAITAELGTMKVGEEIEALEVMAIDPVRFLVVPRYLAMLIMLPALTVFGIYVGLFGGWTICHFALHLPTVSFIVRVLESATAMDLYVGVIKSVVFAWLIAGISCQAGLETRGGAEGVGRSTTGSVVSCILAMLVANAVLTALFFFGFS
jgi:phospholipid/cholesterol/gamma-HCH transport system permease protein